MNTLKRRYTLKLTAVMALIPALAYPITSLAGDANLHLKHTGQLTIGLTLAYAPFSYIKDGKPAGFDVEALKLVSHQMGVTPKFKDMQFSQVILSVKDGTIDITPGLYITPQRAKVVKLVPYFSTGTDIVVESSIKFPPTTALQLCGHSVSSIKGAAVANIIRTQTNKRCEALGKGKIDVHEYPTDPGATQALLAGAVDAQLTASPIARTVVKKTNHGLKISNSKPLFPIQVGWGISKSNKALAKHLQHALKEVSKSGAYLKLLQEYGLSEYDPTLVKKALAGGK